MVGDFGESAVGDGMVQDDAVRDLRDLRDEAIASGCSNSVGDSGNI